MPQFQTIAQRVGLTLGMTVLMLIAALGTPATSQSTTGGTARLADSFGPSPAVPDGAFPDDLKAAVETAFVEAVQANRWGTDQTLALNLIAASGDPRVAWIIADLMRFIADPSLSAELASIAGKVLGKPMSGPNPWGTLTDHLMAWDIPAPPDYLRVKRAIFTGIVPGWEQIFTEGDIDWRHVSWGGVLIDARPFGATDERCNCIPAADNPAVTTAEEATWLDDAAIVFGVEVNGDFRAYPRRIMEVREMVNDTLGGRHLGIPYCTLCGSAQAYFTDGLPEGVARPVLRTSGLLIRSNKVMYDITTHSVFDTFLGRAVTGPLAERGVQLEQASVVTTDWASWKRAHPQTTVLAEELALGRDFDFRNTRDANGPIFPVGDVDPRLSVHEDIIGAITADGRPVAFERARAMAALGRGEAVGFADLRLVLDAGGIRVVGADGADRGSHQAFWFAWSQFHPGTALWPE